MAPHNTRFLRACRGEDVDRVPVWMMRQAGRYMPEYQAVRAEAGGFHELCTNPKLAARATLEAARILQTDAAIIFSDITLPGEAMGLTLTFSPGPKFANPVRAMTDIANLREVEPERDLAYVLEAIRLTRHELDPEVSLIGFVGAPFTLAAYMIEGDPSKQWIATKRLAYGSPPIMHALLERVSDTVAKHAKAQLDAGCDVIQLFDTSAGHLAADELRVFAFAYAKRVIAKLKAEGLPVIYFARDIGAHLEEAATLGADVLGIDWTVTMSEARKRLPQTTALMGNLDPVSLFTNRAEVRARVQHILDEMQGRRGFIFNLGHGVLPETPVENVKEVVRAVRNN